MVHQDYIVRQRYSNALPPPPGAPKLLDIPNNGLKLYTMPFYAEPLLREQPINIEADAFLGMPIDLVGMPGVFDGDESSIQASAATPLPHPRDKDLLVPSKDLGKRESKAEDASFLRKTQYTAEEKGLGQNVLLGKANPNKLLKNGVLPAQPKDDGTRILRNTIKGFDVANPESAYTRPDNAHDIRGLAPSAAEEEAWKNPKHPSKPHLTPLEVYPILPDLDAITGSIAYGVVRLHGAPTTKTDGPDQSLQVSLLHSLDPTPQDAAE